MAILSLGAGLIGALIALIVLWIIISIPVYIAAKLVAGPNATIGRAMGATLIGPIVFTIVVLLGGMLFGSGAGVTLLALIVAFLAWLWVYKEIFRTGWLGSLGIAILSVIATIIIAAILAVIGIVALAL
jgi:hypothetical protein